MSDHTSGPGPAPAPLRHLEKPERLFFAGDVPDEALEIVEGET